MAGRDIVLRTDIVEQEYLPFLSSKESRKRAGVKIDIKEDEIVIFGQEKKLQTNVSRHYTLQL